MPRPRVLLGTLMLGMLISVLVVQAYINSEFRGDHVSSEVGYQAGVPAPILSGGPIINTTGGQESSSRMPERTIALTFVIGAALAAVAGTMYLLYYGVVNFADGFVPGVKAFTAAVLGGIGSLPGAVIGGLIIGLVETLWSAYFSIEYKDVAAFSILAIVLTFMPSGLLGRPEVEKV